MRTRLHLLGIGFLLALVVASCGGSGSTATPTTPSNAATASATGSSGTGSGISSAVIDLGVLTPEGTPDAGVQAPVVGIVAKIAGTCPTLDFVLSGVTIHLSATTKIEGGACGDIKEGMRAGAMGTRRTDGSVDAQRVKIGPPPPAPVTGIVASLAGTCPNLTFTLEGVTIHTSSKTVFDGGKCGDLQNGMRAGAIGPKLPDGSVDAEHVKMAAAPPPPPPPPSTVGGPVKSLSGTCPSLTFVLSGTTVRTSSATTYEGGACADIKNDVRLGAMGPKASDGAIDAEKVKFAPPPPPGGGQVSGEVISVSGTCPDLTFVIGSTTVHTNSKTIWVNGSTCADLKAGVKAGATGPKRADGSIDAERAGVAKG